MKSSSDEELRERLQRTSGGSSETEEKEFTVRPMRRPSLALVLTTVTPVANCPRARRKSRRSNFSAAACLACCRNVSASVASTNQGKNERGSSKPLTMASATSGNFPAESRILITCGGGFSSVLVHSVTQRA